MSTRFIVAGPQRSGTTAVHSVLLGHRQVSMVWGEIQISSFFGDSFGAWTFGNESYHERRLMAPALFDVVTSMHAVDGVRACGMKVAVAGHDRAITLTNHLREFLPNVRLVVTVREDLVAQFGSMERAKTSGTWHTWDAGSGPEGGGGMIRIDKDAFVQYARGVRHSVAQLRSLADQFPIFEISYERDICSGRPYWNSLFEFLGLDDVPVNWKTTTKTSPEPETYIENYAEMRTLLDSMPVPTAESERQAALDALVDQIPREKLDVALARSVWLVGRGEKVAVRSILGKLEARHDAPRPEQRFRLCGLRVIAMHEPESQGQLAASHEELCDLAGGARADFVLDLASQLRKLGLVETARALIVAVLDTRRDSVTDKQIEWAARMLEQIWEHGDWDEAATVARSLTEKYAQSAPIVELLGLVEFARGRSADAAEWLKRALELDPGRGRAAKRLGELNLT